MLLPLLASIEKNNPNAITHIYWEDIDVEIIETLQKTFTRTQWSKTSFNFSNDVTKRISSKTLVWELAAQENQNLDEWLVFLDADTLVIQEILPYLQAQQATAIFTHRDSSFPINSGVVAFVSGPKTATFFTLWQKETMRILSDPSLFAQANNRALPFGGADQMALHVLLGYQRGVSKYPELLEKYGLEIKMVPCDDLNETASVPLSSKTRIIHYKGGWRSILFENGPFTKNRPKPDSWEMYLLYIKTFKEAVATVNARLGQKNTLADFGFKLPFYVNTETGQEKRGFYVLYTLHWQIKHFIPRVLLYLKERL